MTVDGGVRLPGGTRATGPLAAGSTMGGVDGTPAKALLVDDLTKPFAPWILRAKVSVFVELWTKTRLLEAQAEAARQLRAMVTAVDEAVAVLRTGTEPERALAILEAVQF